jgi:hypothetical protein
MPLAIKAAVKSVIVAAPFSKESPFAKKILKSFVSKDLL